MMLNNPRHLCMTYINFLTTIFRLSNKCSYSKPSSNVQKNVHNVQISNLIKLKHRFRFNKYAT